MSPERFREIIQHFPHLPPVAVVGDVGVDKYTFGEVERISPEAPVPVLKVEREWFKLGMAANITHNLKTLGVGSTLFGLVGEDPHGALLEGLLEDEGLKTWGLVSSSARQTTLKERILTGRQQICRVDHEAPMPLTEDEQDRLKARFLDLSQARAPVIIQDYAKGAITPSFSQWLIQISRKEGRLVAVDPARGVDPLIYQGACLIKPNQREALDMAQALGLAHEGDLGQVAVGLSQRLQIHRVVITQGAMGMLIYDQTGPPQMVPTPKTEVYDVSGAGDTVMGLLTVALESQASLYEAACLANLGAQVVVGKNTTATVGLNELRASFEG